MKYHWKYMRDVVDWIEDRLCDGLDLDEIASYARCSPYHFARIFHEHSGMSVLAYVRRRVHLHAARELRDGVSVADTALEYGYQSASSFTRAFRRSLGKTPREYRLLATRIREEPTTDTVEIKNVSDHGTLRLSYDLADYALKLSSRSHMPYTYDYFLEQLEGQSPFLLYAKSDARVVGVAFGSPQANNHVTVAFVAVEESHRRRGIGKLLMLEMIERVRNEGRPGMAMGSNEDAEEFLIKCGFTPTLFLQSHNHSLDELRTVNDRYRELWGTESGISGWCQLMLETREIDSVLRRRYDELIEDCIPQIVFRLHFETTGGRMDRYKIRRIGSVDELLEVWNMIFAQISHYNIDEKGHIFDLKKHFRNNRDLMLMVEHDGLIVGGAVGFGNTLRAIGIAPEHRGRGLGRRLMRVFEFSAMKSGRQMVCLGSDPDNKDFFVKLGYHGKRKSMMKEFPLPGRVLDLKMERLDAELGDLDSGYTVAIEENAPIPALTMAI